MSWQGQWEGSWQGKWVGAVETNPNAMYGSAAGTSTVSGTLTTGGSTADVAGSAAGTSTASGTLTVGVAQVSIYGTAAGSSTVSGTLTYEGQEVVAERRPRSVKLQQIQEARVYVSEATVGQIRTVAAVSAKVIVERPQYVGSAASARPSVLPQFVGVATAVSGSGAPVRRVKATAKTKKAVVSAGTAGGFSQAHIVPIQRRASVSSGSTAEFALRGRWATKYSPAYVQAINNPSDEELAILALKLTNYL